MDTESSIRNDSRCIVLVLRRRISSSTSTRHCDSSGDHPVESTSRVMSKRTTTTTGTQAQQAPPADAVPSGTPAIFRPEPDYGAGQMPWLRLPANRLPLGLADLGRPSSSRRRAGSGLFIQLQLLFDVRRRQYCSPTLGQYCSDMIMTAWPIAKRWISIPPNVWHQGVARRDGSWCVSDGRGARVD